MKNISIQKKYITWVSANRLSNNPGQISNHYKKILKRRITATLNSYYYKNNNNNKYRQGSMNISEDVTIKRSNKTNKNIFTVTKVLNLISLDLI